MLVSLYLLFTQREFCRQAKINRLRAFLNLFWRPKTEAVWLLSHKPHMREGMLLKRFQDRIAQYHYGCDWKRAWLIVLNNPRVEFIVCSLDDLTFWPLKFHPFSKNLVFDSYDPLREYIAGRDFLTKINYKFGKRFIFRDCRFKEELLRVGNTKAEVCYVPDTPQFSVMRNYRDKFREKKIRFISSGWATSRGDGSILESLYLVDRTWPDNEIHLCLTQFMHPYDKTFEALLEFIRVRPNCFVHNNLNQKDYGDLLSICHVGLNLHDPLTFGKPYKQFNLDMVNKSPSSRALDYASAGLILMTNKEMGYSIRQFKKYSPHRMVLNLTYETKYGELTTLMEEVANGKEDR